MLYVLNLMIDTFFKFSFCKKVIRYAVNRFDGFQYGSYGLADEVFLALCMAQICPTGAVIDAGANKGEWSCAFLAIERDVHKLIIIEPAPIHSKPLTEMANRHPNIFFENVAVGADAGIMNLYFNHEGSALASLYNRDLRYIGVELSDSIPVPVLTLDEIAKKHDLTQIAFLKLDLEGHEIFALKGAATLLKNKTIWAMTFEFGGCNIDSRTFFKDFWSLLVLDNGYRIFRILPGRRLLYLSNYSESLEQFSWQNLLACAPGVNPTWPISLS